MRIEVGELDRLHVRERRRLLGEAVGRVNESHGRMGNAAHYVGGGLAAVIVVWGLLSGRGVLVVATAATAAYVGALLVGIVLWRRSMIRTLEQVVRELIDARKRVRVVPRRLFTVEDRFMIKGRGVVTIPGIVPRGEERFWVGDAIELRRPDGSVVATRIGGFEMFYPGREDWAVVVTGLEKEEVPVGTAVWSVEGEGRLDRAR